jgi:hypothetical protein
MVHINSLTDPAQGDRLMAQKLRSVHGVVNASHPAPSHSSEVLRLPPVGTTTTTGASITCAEGGGATCAASTMDAGRPARWADVLAARERQIAGDVAALEAWDYACGCEEQQQRIAARDQRRQGLLLTAKQRALKNVELMQRCHQPVPARALEAAGLTASDAVATATMTGATMNLTAEAARRAAARELPQLAHLEFHGPRLEAAFARREVQREALRRRAEQRVAFEAHVGTGFSVRRAQLNAVVDAADQAADVLGAGGEGGAGTSFAAAQARSLRALGGSTRFPTASELQRAAAVARQVEHVREEQRREREQLWREVASLDDALRPHRDTTLDANTDEEDAM